MQKQMSPTYCVFRQNILQSNMLQSAAPLITGTSQSEPVQPDIQSFCPLDPHS